jgi:NADH:flavin oxidoreductases, Old Yellow Enzyme family
MRAFEPLIIKNTVLKNRIVFPPTYTCMGVDSDEALEYYTKRAKGGAALVIVEGTDVDLLKDRTFMERVSRLAQSINEAGAAAVLQIRAHLFNEQDGVWVSEKPGMRSVTLEEIEESVEAFGYAARMAERAGFVGVDIHGAHGFLLNKFFSPIENKREDKYGGSLENRMRYGLDVVAFIRKQVSEDFLIFYRHSPVEGGDGYTIEESLKFAAELEKAGIDVMDLSPGKGPVGEVAEHAAPFKKVLGIPVMTVNGFNKPENIEKALNDVRCDLVGIGRGLIADPELPLKLQQGREQDIVTCIECNKFCYGNIGTGKPVSCVRHKK